jgi:hypothetical protein
MSLEIVDTVTGVDYNSYQTAMEPSGDGRFSTRLPLPLGSLIRYRYRSMGDPSAYEATAPGQTLRYRVAYVAAPMQLQDQVAVWEGGVYGDPTGRILGQVVEKTTGRPISEMIVTASGIQTFSDGEGKFRIEGLLPGLTNLVAYHPSGSYAVFQQGAMIAPGATTPALLEMDPAAPVTLSFQLTVPAGTPSTPRIVGNVLPLADIFASAEGGLELSAARAPELVRVDGEHFIFLTQLYAGTDLRYKYTLGDGLWNAERSSAGSFVTRQLIVPETDFVINDTVAAWGSGGEATTIHLQVPPSTPEDDAIGIQFNPFTWFEPLPMVSGSAGGWNLELLGPVDFPQPIRYRYCRNLICSAGEAGDPDRSLDPSRGGAIDDEIGAWEWWDGQSVQPDVIAPEIQARPGMELGIELVPAYSPTWPRYGNVTMERARSVGSNVVVMTSAWELTGTRSIPRIEFDPNRAPYESDLLQLSRAARSNGLGVILRPELHSGSRTQQQWWESGARDPNWWAVFYSELRSFLLSQAVLAERVEAEKLVLTGTQLHPSVAGGTLPSGDPSGAPFESVQHWEEILAAMRAIYSGAIAYEVELTDKVGAKPPFLEQIDEVHVYWHAPLAQANGETVPVLELEAERLVDQVLLPSLPQEMPVVLSMEYPSSEGALRACPPAEDGGCLPSELLDIVALTASPALSADPLAQAQAYNAVLLAAHDQPRILGFLSRRFMPLALQDLSASVYGKPAADVLWYWYPRLLGETVGP